MKSSLFHWAGSRLLSKTVLRRKRKVTGQDGKARYCAFDLRRWVTPPDDGVMGAAWQRIAQKHERHLAGASSKSRANVKAKCVWHFVVERVKYARDHEQFDAWQLPPETLTLGHGDCEDRAFLAVSLLLAAGISPQRVRVAIGAVLRAPDGRGTKRAVGHACPLYRNSRGVWCLLETSLKHLPVRVAATAERRAHLAQAKRAVGVDKATFVRADSQAADSHRRQFVPLVCLNHDHVWGVEECCPGQVAGARRIHPDWDANPTFQQIWRRARHLTDWPGAVDFDEQWPP